MLPGRGKQKGSNWERTVGHILSMWLTENQRSNIFARNVLSGGGFTVTVKGGKETPNIPGDLMAANPLAFAYLSLFSVECKNTEQVDLSAFLYDKHGKSFLMKTIDHTRQQAFVHGLSWMIFAKHNYHEAIVLMEGEIGDIALAASPFPSLIKYHRLYSGSYMMMSFEHLTRLVNPRRFVSGVQAWKESNAEPKAKAAVQRSKGALVR